MSFIRNQHLYLLFIFSFFLVRAASGASFVDTIQQKQGMERAREKCRQLLLSDVQYASEQSYSLTDDIKYDKDGDGYFKYIKADGSFPDIDYQSSLRNSWKPSWHLFRLMLICRRYFKNNDPRYLDVVHRGLRFWRENDFQCSNWWQNQINVPFAYSSLMLMLDKNATKEELDFLNNTLTKRTWVNKATGQNLIWQQDNQARIALMNRDSQRFERLMKEMPQVIDVSAKEGIQPDYSFQQHGEMLQFGNYGTHFLNSLIFWMSVTAGGPYDFPEEKKQAIYHYAVDGLKWTIYQGAMDITAVGRQIRNNYTAKRGINLYDDFQLLKIADPDKSPCRYALSGFTPVVSGCDLSGNKAFWRSAYMIHRDGSKFMMSVKMAGTRVKKVEAINGENLKGTFLNDGVTLIQRTGSEYKNIEALWNWDMLPGTTCDTTVDPANKRSFDSFNRSQFVGMVSNRTEGISTMIYNRLGINANKSYFFVDNLLVALGSGIVSANPKNTVTTVNQRFTSGVTKTGETVKGYQWVWQDSTLYLSLQQSQYFKSVDVMKSGNWRNIDEASDDKIIHNKLSAFYIEQANSDHYAYLVQPAVALRKTEKLKTMPVSVIDNISRLQSIKIKDRYLAVFYQPGSLVDNGHTIITTDQPCALIAKKEKSHWHIWIADPTGKLINANLTLGQTEKIQVIFPSGDLAGSTKELTL